MPVARGTPWYVSPERMAGPQHAPAALAALAAFAALAAPAVVAALAAGGVIACGPSFQAVYESDVHFEHCYALDEKSVSEDLKKDCWREWLRGYTYGQSNDRVEYAATRFSQLSLDPTLPSEDVRDAGARRAHKPERTIAAPLPTSAFAPPPNVNTLEVRDAAASVDASRVREVHALAQAPGSECVAGCEDRWNGCRGGCKNSACDACDRAYRACMPTCFQAEAGAPRPLPLK